MIFRCNKHCYNKLTNQPTHTTRKEQPNNAEKGAQCSSKVSVKKFMNKWEKKDLETLADDFGLLQRNDVQEIIQNCKTYAEGQRKIMRVYTKVYL